MAVINWLPKPIDGANGEMEAPLRAIDIRDTLNAYGGKVTNKLTSFFSTDANINKWSKHKPIVTGYVNDIFIGFEEIKPDGIDVWEKQNGSIPTYVSDYKKAWEGCSDEQWYVYTPPRGVTNEYNEPMRLGDFRGYRADATSAFKAFCIDEASADHVAVNGDQNNIQVYIRCYLNDELANAEGGMLSLNDLGIFSKIGNTHRVAVVDKFTTTGGTEEWNMYLGDTLNNNWVRTEIQLPQWTVDDMGTHELGAIIASDAGDYIPLPFPHRIITVEKWYTGDAFIDFNASFQYGYEDVPDSGEFKVDFTYVQATPYDETKEYNVQIYYGTADSPIDPVFNNTFTITGEDTTPAGQHCYKTTSHRSDWRINMSNPLFKSILELWYEGNLYAWYGNTKVKVDNYGSEDTNTTD